MTLLSASDTPSSDRRVFPVLSRLAGGLVDALFPPACPACRGETATGQTLCPACWNETAFLSGNGCCKCKREIPGLDAGSTDSPRDFLCDSCQAHPPHWERGAAVFAYEGAGRRVLLVDDVLTTGATLSIVVAICREACAVEVGILVLALVSFDETPYLRSA